MPHTQKVPIVRKIIRGGVHCGPCVKNGLIEKKKEWPNGRQVFAEP